MKQDHHLTGGGYAAILLLLLVLLVLMAVISISCGRYYIEPQQVVRILINGIHPLDQTWPAQAASVIYTLRLPRVIAAVMIGAALALSGASYQSVFKNPLVAPDMLGVSSGACVGASLAILLGISQAGIQIGAFVGGIIAVACAVSIPRIIGKNSIVMLVLAGIIVGGLMNSFIGIIKYIADTDTQLPAITYWQLGSLTNVVWNNILYSGIPIAICLIFMMLIRWRMNILTLSEEEAHMLSAHSEWLRYAVIFCATILTACSVCVSGTIGWVGLVIPHFSRLLVGPNNQRMLPVSVVLGALFLLVIDTLSRATMTSEIPLSILTGLIGAPFYFFLLLKQRLSLS
ncbi:FecCD family ABC transporter permease [Dialister sp.]|uniref:FecCD family ABC transporter permease n=1 Tax=Dialister sp. TaxID=1955814 RepID=UPI003F0C989A